MLKRLILLLIVLIGLQMTPTPGVFAQGAGGGGAVDDGGRGAGDAINAAVSDLNAREAATATGAILDSSSFQFDLSSITHEEIEGSVRQSWIRRGLNYFFERIISVMAGVIGGAAVLMLMVGGFLMLSSAGQEAQYDKGKAYVKFSIIGLVFVLSAYILVTLVQLLIKSIYG